MIEILILENTIVVEQYKELIDGEKNKDWNVGIARNIKEAVAYAKKVDLHVLIFDQRLDDEELGTEAFKKIIELSPLVQGIMLSGMATADELKKAEDYGGSCLYLNKRDVLSLPEMINEAISRYYLAPRTSVRVDKVIKKFYKFPFLFFYPIKLKLLSYSKLEDKYVNDDKWETRIIARAGEEHTKEQIHTKNIEVVLKNTTKCNAGLEAGINLEEINAAIKEFIENELQISSQIKIEDIDKETIKIAIPPIPEDTSKVYMIETRCEVAPSYKRIKVHLALECSYCNSSSYLDYECLIPNNVPCKRQVSVYSDGKKTVTML